jgi:ribosomal protein S18 acetylase RimI-like enzyme
LSQTLTIRRASTDEAGTLSEILAQAFANDPACQWGWPDATLRPAVSRAFFRVFAGSVLENGEAFLDDSGQGAALWLPFDPSDDHVDEAFVGALVEACHPFEERLGIIDELMTAAHPKHSVHAYLPFIGVTPTGQGNGIGSQLLDSRLREIDRAGLPAYLEATTFDSVRLYERHGFRRLEHTIDLPDGPSMYPMWREPRSA